MLSPMRAVPLALSRTVLPSLFTLQRSGAYHLIARCLLALKQRVGVFIA
jgi:hypothetical protein